MKNTLHMLELMRFKASGNMLCGLSSGMEFETIKK